MAEMTLEELHRHMVETQVENLEFYVGKYALLAEVCRSMGHGPLADLCDEMKRNTEGVLVKTRDLLAPGAN